MMIIAFRMRRLIVVLFGSGFILATLLSLAGCWFNAPSAPVVEASASKPISFASRRQVLAQIARWQLVGSFSIQQAGQLGIIANYQWNQFNNIQYQIDINAPLNLMHVAITGQSGLVTLQTAQGQFVHAVSPELLMQQALGWSLPISDLRYWIRGLPAPMVPSLLYFDHSGHITQLQQEGWQVHFVNYQLTSKGIDLPREIELSRAGLFARIFLRQWVLP